MQRLGLLSASYDAEAGFPSTALGVTSAGDVGWVCNEMAVMFVSGMKRGAILYYAHDNSLFPK